jgi:hypothetical protein
MVQTVEARATAQLAKGMAAAKSDNIVEALAFFSDALNSNTTRAEANRNIQSFFTAIPTGSITQRANFAIEQKAKWDKIFADLAEYIYKNLPIFIYNFSIVQDSIDIRSNSVSLTIRPGIKVIPNRAVLLVYKTIVDNWRQIRGKPENRDWAGNVRPPRLGNVSGSVNRYIYQSEFGLYDDYGDRVAVYSKSSFFTELSIQSNRDPFIDSFEREFQVTAQHKYYDDTKFQEIRFTVPLNEVTDNMTPKIDKIYIRPDSYSRSNDRQVDFSSMTVTEYQEWLRSQ